MRGSLIANVISTKQIEIKDTMLCSFIKEGDEIRVASSNNSAKILKIDGSVLTLDEDIKSANSNILLIDDVIIFPYNSEPLDIENIATKLL